MEITRVGVLGCCTMGAGICEVVARAGLSVSFAEPGQVEAGLAGIDLHQPARRVPRARLRPAPLLGQMVGAGYLGRKTGRGFSVHD